MRDETHEARTQVLENGSFLIIKWNKNEQKQAGRQRTVAVNITHTRQKTKDQHRSTDTRRINRETNEGNEGDTGGATETVIR